MKFLGELTEKEAGIPNPKGRSDCLKVRRTVRAIALNEQGQLPLVFLESNSYHILPGGSFESDEGLEKGLQREFIEETGFEVKVTGEVGVIITHEYCSDTIQINYCYLGAVGKKIADVEYTEEEAEQNPSVIWVSLDEATALLKADKPRNDYGRFNSARDLQFCLEAKRLVQK